MKPGNALHKAIARELFNATAAWVSPSGLFDPGLVRSSEQWIFVANLPPEGEGTICGAGRHVDRVEAASSIHWQLAGKKRWTMWPHPLCGTLCSTLEFDVQPGEIFVFSNDVWDHATQVPGTPGGLSVSVEVQYSPAARRKAPG